VERGINLPWTNKKMWYFTRNYWKYILPTITWH